MSATFPSNNDEQIRALAEQLAALRAEVAELRKTVEKIDKRTDPDEIRRRLPPASPRHRTGL